MVAFSRIVRYSFLAALAGLLVYVGYGFFFQPSPVKAGEKAPDFQKPDLAGRPVSLAQYQGKVVVLNFFTTWCDPCRQEAPDLAKFDRDIPQDKVVFLMVDRKEAKASVQKFIDEFHLTNRVVLDTNDSLAAPYGISGQPETFFIGSNGTVRFHQIGPLNENDLNQLLLQTLYGGSSMGK